MTDPVHLSFFHDLLCAYCCVTAGRLRQLEEEFGDLVVVELRPYPIRLEEAAPEVRDVRRQVRLLKRASKEPDAFGLTPSLWRGIDPPVSHVAPLRAVEAARDQGRELQRRLADKLREMALRGGINVARRDVQIEVAASLGLDVERFLLSLDDPETLRAVEESRIDGLSHGVKAVPAVVIADEWLLTGVRELHEYRDVLLRWLERQSGGPSPVALN